MTNGWQYDKTALESHLYMLENEIMTDVCFDVGQTEDVLVRIRAHKYTLVSRSEVFDAMFSSGMTETQGGGHEAKVRIEDIEPEVFKQMLRFIYSDNAEITMTSALELMYAAKKYMLPKLAQLCSECLMKSVTTENVCRILNQSLLFDESDLTENCIDLIERNSSEVLKPQNLLLASRQTMETILQLDSLAEEETVIYDACINWAKTQLRIQRSIDDPNDQQIREVLGDLIYEMRFPTMDAKAFAKLVESCTILSYEEQSSILCYILSEHMRDSLKFNCNERSVRWKSSDEETFIDRGGRIGLQPNLWRSGHDAIDVKTDRTILVTGLGLLPTKDLSATGYTVDLEILKSTKSTISKSVFKMSAFVPYTWNSKPFKVLFTTPVIMKREILYTIIANSGEGKLLHYRLSCPPTGSASDVTFTFSRTECRRCNCTSVKRGQIPQIYFRGPK